MTKETRLSFLIKALLMVGLAGAAWWPGAARAQTNLNATNLAVLTTIGSNDKLFVITADGRTRAIVITNAFKGRTLYGITITNSDGSGLTNLQASKLVGTIPSLAAGTVSFTNAAGSAYGLTNFNPAQVVKQGSRMLLCSEGDSETAQGVYNANRNFSWWDQLITNSPFVGPLAPLMATNLGVGGQLVSTMAANWASKAGRYLTNSAALKIYTLWGGVNDCDILTPAATTYASLTNMAYWAKTNGAKVVMFVPSPWWGDGTTNGWKKDGSGAAYNIWVTLTNSLVTASSNWDVLIDVPRLVGNYTYDTLHYTDQGNKMITSLLANGLCGGSWQLPSLAGLALESDRAGMTNTDLIVNGMVKSVGGYGLQSSGATAGLVLYGRAGGQYLQLLSPAASVLQLYDSAAGNNVLSWTNSGGHLYLDANNTTDLSLGKNSSGPVILYTGSTNQIMFGATNTAPGTPGTVSKWVSVMINGETNAYRIPLYK